MSETPPSVVKVITTNDLYDEVVGLREDVRNLLEEHRPLPEEVKKLRTDVDGLLRFRYYLSGAILASGGLGAWIAKALGS